MKIFMSWSGRRSHATAELLSWWVRCVIQASRPWISSEDVDRGSLWFTQISNGLSDTAVGIVCLTHENKDRPWILFEAGALAKGLSDSRVCTFLVDLEHRDIRDPLAQFNHTQPNIDDMRKLIRTLNSCMGTAALEQSVLNDAFNTYWPQFEERFAKLMADIPQEGVVEVRKEGDVLSEILEHVRGMNQRIRHLESLREQLPSWLDNPPRFPEESSPHRPTEIDLLREITGAAANGVAVEKIQEFARRWRVDQETVDRVVSSVKAEKADRESFAVGTNMLTGAAVLRPRNAKQKS